MAQLRILGLILAIGSAAALAQNPGNTTAPSPASQPVQSQPAQAQQKQDAAPSEIVVPDPKIAEKDRKKAEATPQTVMQMPKLADTPITRQTRILVMRSLNAETVFARKALPLGKRGVVLKDGKMSPPDTELAMLVATFGPAVKPGDRAQITDVKIGDKTILFELNGGPAKKKKWYQHIEIGGMGGSVPISRQDPNQANSGGTTVELAFDKFVPEMTGDQVRQLLSPVLDFHAKSAAEAYLDTVPPKVKHAIVNHEVLVGMNREMVQYAKGRPEKKIHEKDDTGKPYEEWMYGEPPAEVQFIRFYGDEVGQVKIMTVDGQKIVRTQKEVDTENGTAVLAKKTEPVEQNKPAHAPSLKRPGEGDDKDSPMKQTGTRSPTSGSSQDDQEWGVPKPGQGTPAPDPNAPKPTDAGTSVPK
jgi:hypothetical protein